MPNNSLLVRRKKKHGHVSSNSNKSHSTTFANSLQTKRWNLSENSAVPLPNPNAKLKWDLQRLNFGNPWFSVRPIQRKYDLIFYTVTLLTHKLHLDRFPLINHIILTILLKEKNEKAVLSHENYINKKKEY